MKILLIGYYGYGNIGDDALLSAALDNIQNQAAAKCTVLTYNAEQTRRQYGVEAISRGRHFKLIQAVYKTDIVIVGGGSILQDITSSRSLYYYLAILATAKIFGKKTYLVGNGYGPITKKYNRRLIRWLVSGMNGIVARDQKAYDAYKALGAKKLFSGVDLAYLLNGDGTAYIKADKPYVAISLRTWANTSNLLNEMKKVTDYLIQSGFGVKLVPMKHPEDTLVLEKLVDNQSDISIVSHDMEAILQTLKSAKFVIGMRLHALILSAVMGVPFIGISYDPKVDSFVSQVMGIKPLQATSMTYEQVKEEIDDILNHYEAMQTRVKSSTDVNSTIAAQQMQTFMGWIKEDKA